MERSHQSHVDEVSLEEASSNLHRISLVCFGFGPMDVFRRQPEQQHRPSPNDEIVDAADDDRLVVFAADDFEVKECLEH